MQSIISHSPAETEAAGARLAKELKSGDVIALFGGLGMGKTTFVRGMAAGLGLTDKVSSPTFAIAHEYGGDPPLVHFDMYRICGWDDLYSTGFFEYLDSDAIIVIEWSENIGAALPEDSKIVEFERVDQNTRRIVIGQRGGKDHQ